MKKLTLFLFLMSMSALYAQNQMQIINLSMMDSYSQIPLGQVMPFSIEAKFINNGTFLQNNVKLHVKELATQTIYVSDSLINFYQGNTDSLRIDSIILPNSVGSYYIIAWLSSDGINQLMYNDTFKIKINDKRYYARDNNNYTGYRWAGVSNGISNVYTATNIFTVKQSLLVNGLNFVVANGTSINSKVSANLFKWDPGLGNIIIVNQSDIHYLTASEIPVANGPNPPSVTLFFRSSYILSPDTIYYAGVYANVTTDTVKIATDSTSIPQHPQNCPYFSISLNNWYIWANVPSPAMMIRLNDTVIPFFNASPLFQYVNSAAYSNCVFNINANLTSWNTSTLTPWISLVNDTINGRLIVTATTANNSANNRSGTITITANGFLPQTLNVYQLPSMKINDARLSEVKLYPNPSGKYLNLSNNEWNDNLNKISISSVAGIEIKNFNVKILNKNLLEFDISSLSKGMYFIEIKNDKQSIIKKFVKE